MDDDHSSKALATSPSTLPNRLDPQSVRAALADRIPLSEAIGIVGKMLRGYANGGRDASAGYIGALAEVLAQYPRCVASQAGDLVRGVPRDCKFLPTPADVIAWCERETEPLRGIVHKYDEQQGIIAEMRKRREEGEKAAAARKTRPTLEDLKAKYGPNWGIGAFVDSSDQVARSARHPDLPRTREHGSKSRRRTLRCPHAARAGTRRQGGQAVGGGGMSAQSMVEKVSEALRAAIDGNDCIQNVCRRAPCECADDLARVAIEAMRNPTDQQRAALEPKTPE